MNIKKDLASMVYVWQLKLAFSIHYVGLANRAYWTLVESQLNMNLFSLAVLMLEMLLLLWSGSIYLDNCNMTFLVIVPTESFKLMYSDFLSQKNW